MSLKDFFFLESVCCLEGCYSFSTHVRISQLLLSKFHFTVVWEQTLHNAYSLKFVRVRFMDRNILCGLEKCVGCWYGREWSTDVNGTRMTDGVAELHCALTERVVSGCGYARSVVQPSLRLCPCLPHVVWHSCLVCTRHWELFVLSGNRPFIIRQCPPLPLMAFLAVTNISTALLVSDLLAWPVLLPPSLIVRVGALWTTSSCSLFIDPPRQSLSSLVHVDQTFEVMTDV